MSTLTHAHGNAHAHDHDEGKTPLGFWIYLMSDCVLFASIFAGFIVLRDNLNGGPSGRELFDLTFVAVETGLLLVSSLTYGLGMIAAAQDKLKQVFFWLGVTFLCGFAFVAMEVYEFGKLIHEGAGPDRSAFLSGFFTLVGTHGLHVTSGLVWMAVMIGLLALRGLTPSTRMRLLCLSLFWHFLDIVWIGVFSVVYLMGAA